MSAASVGWWVGRTQLWRGWERLGQLFSGPKKTSGQRQIVKVAKNPGRVDPQRQHFYFFMGGKGQSVSVSF